MKPNPNKRIDRASIKNVMEYGQYFNRLCELALSRFEWTGLPESIDPRYLEMTLFNEGKAIFFKDEVLGHLALKCNTSGEFNVYGVPVIRTAYANNGYNRQLTEKDSVIIWNNYMRTDTATDVDIFARRLYDLDCTIDINAKAQKTPIIVRCNENQRLTLKNLYEKYEGNVPFIFADKTLDMSALTVVNTNAPYLADKLYQLRNEIWNEALTYLGINNVNVVKKERLISDEVMRQQGGVIASRFGPLEMRRKACEEINKMFNLNVSCDYRQDYREVTDNYMVNDDSVGKEITQVSTNVQTGGADK